MSARLHRSQPLFVGSYTVFLVPDIDVAALIVAQAPLPMLEVRMFDSSMDLRSVRACAKGDLAGFAARFFSIQGWAAKGRTKENSLRVARITLLSAVSRGHCSRSARA